MVFFATICSIAHKKKGIAVFDKEQTPLDAPEQTQEIKADEPDKVEKVDKTEITDEADKPNEPAIAEKTPKSHKKRLKQIIAIIVGIAACVILIAPSIAGYLNVSVISTSGQFTGQECKVLLYEGDVVALLADADPSNDPEPVKENQIVVGQRTTFNGMNFGTYTMDVVLLDEQADSQVSITPRTTTMWGIDNRQTYEIA